MIYYKSDCRQHHRSLLPAEQPCCSYALLHTMLPIVHLNQGETILPHPMFRIKLITTLAAGPLPMSEHDRTPRLQSQIRPQSKKSLCFWHMLHSSAVT